MQSASHNNRLYLNCIQTINFLGSKFDSGDLTLLLIGSACSGLPHSCFFGSLPMLKKRLRWRLGIFNRLHVRGQMYSTSELPLSLNFHNTADFKAQRSELHPWHPGYSLKYSNTQMMTQIFTKLNLLKLMLLFFYVGSLTAMENLSARNRLMIGLSVKFSECHEETTLKSSSTITKRGQLFDVNRRAVYHSLEQEVVMKGSEPSVLLWTYLL